MIDKITIATNNPIKSKELIDIFNNQLDNIIHFNNVDYNIEINEFGMTYEQNALIKAQAWFNRLNTPIIAEDSGLEIEALYNRPGIESNRIVMGDDEYHCKWALYELKNKVNRNAKFISSICLISENGIIITKGELKGTITKKPYGENGFGYDSIFIPNGYDVTFGQLDYNIKNKISHRAKAITKICKIINSYSIMESMLDGEIL